jgi:RHS repeat-associated protein
MQPSAGKLSSWPCKIHFSPHALIQRGTKGTLPNTILSYLDDWYGGANTRGMTYDKLDRLKVTNGPWAGSGSCVSGGFSYDTLDNIVSSTLGSRSLNHEFRDGTNRLTHLSGSQNIDFAYDANGNITRRGSQTYRFDIGNRMIEAVGKASYVYDAEGRRSWVTYQDGTIGGTAYSHKGQLLISGHGRLGTNWYIYLGNKQIAQHKLGGGVNEVLYIHTDALGSPVARTNGSRTESNRTQYEPYGRAHSGGVPEGFELGYTGHVNDTETGLTYMQQRYYEPLAGRFLSVDPVVTDRNTGRSFNRYSYANLNPYRYVDPDGRDPWHKDKDMKDMAPAAAAIQTITIAGARSAAGPGLAIATKLGIYGAAGATTALAVQTVSTKIPGSNIMAGTYGPWMASKAGDSEESAEETESADNAEAAKKKRDTKGDDRTVEGGHRTNQRPSTKEKHQKGDERRIRDQQGEKKDERMRY